MHRSRHPMDISLVVDDDNDEEGSSDHFIPSSTTSDYSSLIVNSPPDTMYHRIRSPSPTSSVSLNHHPMQGAQSTHASTSARHCHRRLSHSSSQAELNGSSSNVHRDRLRFNTWPRHRKEKRDILVEHDKRLAKSIIQELGIGINKTYRNPWGNLSYAQLITRAIDSSPWKRLTLNEVYEWIIKFVPYFKDKIDAKTSWGWKNSIRHNLSLHNQFIRVPVISSLSKGPVKYVWTINPSFKNNSPYKKYSLKRKRAAAAAALASQAAAAAVAAAATSTINSNTSPLASSQEHRSPTSTPSQPLVNMSNNYHRQSSTNSSTPTSIAKATRLGEHSQGNGSSTLNQLSVAAAMMSAGITDPAAYRAFLNSQAAAMMTKHKQQTSTNSSSATAPSSSSTASITHRPTQSGSGVYAHETGLPVPKKVALGADRYKQHQHQQQQHPEWHHPSYRQAAPAPPPPPYNGRPPHPSGSSKMHMNQQHASYLPPPPSATSSARMSSDMNNHSPSLQRRVTSPPSYPSAAAIAAAAAQNKLLAQTKLWHAAVQAAAAHAHQQQQQQYHHQAPPPPPSSSSNAINDLQNYINRSNNGNGNHNKLPGYLNPETLKLLSSTSANNHPVDEQHMYSNDPRYKLMRASYPNATSGSIPTACLIRQRINPSSSAGLTQQQQIDMVTAAYHNYRRRSSGFSSTTSHGGPSDDENDEYAPPRKDSSTSNASSGYESGLAINRQSPPTSSSVRTGSGSSITSEASSSSYYHHAQNHQQHHNNAPHSSSQSSMKMPSNSNDVDMEDPRQLSIHAVGGYVDDLMERIRKMPPKKRSKFYQMLDEERLKDVNNNDHDEKTRSKHDEAGVDDDHNHHVSMEVTMPLVVTEAASDDDDDRTLIEHEPKTESTPMNENEDHNEREETFKQSSPGLNDKTFEELLSLGVPLAVLKAIAFQQHQQSRTSSKKSTAQLSNFLTKKCLATSGKSAAEKTNFLNARTILRKILQQQQKHSISAKSLVEAMDYGTDEDGDLLPDERDRDGDDDDDDDDDEQQSSSSMTPRHRNGIRSNSHNPVTVTLNSNDIASLSPPTSTSSSPDETDVNHQSSPTSISRPSSTPAALISSGCSY